MRKLQLSGKLIKEEIRHIKEDFFIALEKANELELDLTSIDELDVTFLQLMAVAKQYADKNGKKIVIAKNCSINFLAAVEKSGFSTLLGWVYKSAS